MCWDGTDTVAPSFSVTQSFSEVWPSWELPTVLSLVCSHFSNSSFLQGNRKGSLRPGWRYPKLCDCGNLWVPAGHEAMLFGKWQRLQTKKDHRTANPFETKQEACREAAIPAQLQELRGGQNPAMFSPWGCRVPGWAWSHPAPCPHPSQQGGSTVLRPRVSQQCPNTCLSEKDLQAKASCEEEPLNLCGFWQSCTSTWKALALWEPPGFSTRGKMFPSQIRVGI